MNWQEVVDSISRRRTDLDVLRGSCGKTEKTITSMLYQVLEWQHTEQTFDGILGWAGFKSDQRLTFGSGSIVAEVKKVTEGTEYGYWHAAVQGLLYRHQLATSQGGELPILCIVLDWGRRSGERLNVNETAFLNRFRSDSVFFLRFTFDTGVVIEHNLLRECWDVI